MKTFYCFPQGKTKALTMSYDDGMIFDKRLIEIFNRYGIKGTFNLNSGLYEAFGNRPSKEEIAGLYEGHEVATHTSTHPTLERCPLVYAADEILKDRIELERLTGKLVRGHAYPNGSYNEEIKQLFRQLGIAYGRVVQSKDDFALPTDPLEWHPTCHHNAPDLLKKGQWLLDFQKWQYLKLMYVWGHSYEFDRDSNWEVIEDFCRLMGGHEDIWYATNIEIIDYMNVLNRLQFSAKCDMVWNPSAQSAWLQDENGNPFEIAGGTCRKIPEPMKGKTT